MSVHEVQWKTCDPTWKYAPVHWLAVPVVHSCSAPAPEGHVVPSAEVHAGPPWPCGEEAEELLHPPSAVDPASANATAAIATTRGFITPS